jgi:hypothetical protein
MKAWMLLGMLITWPAWSAEKVSHEISYADPVRLKTVTVEPIKRTELIKLVTHADRLLSQNFRRPAIVETHLQ